MKEHPVITSGVQITRRSELTPVREIVPGVVAEIWQRALEREQDAPPPPPRAA